ncbi:hypothetical protein COL922a_002561 [Colletotrichum nupharicola]|nr:hypothetical protein COL922a_002561 [Colletotrichum nupharicola]
MRMSPTIKTEAVTPPTAGRDETDGLTSRMSGLDLDAFPTPPTFGKRQSMGSPTKVKFEKSFDWKSVFNGKKEVKHEIDDPQSHASWPAPVQYPQQTAPFPAPVAKSFDFSNFGRDQSPQFELPARSPDQPPFPIPQRSTSKHNRVKSYSGGTFHFEECGEQVITPPAAELEGPSLAPPLACPYLKHDPKTYEAEVREHLKSQSLCEVLEGVSVEGFDEVQEKQLKSKKRGRVVKSEQDKWKEIYRILFPDSTEIPDPLYNLAFDDTSPPGAAQADHQHAEAIFKQPVPRRLEEETLSLMEDAVGGQLNTKKRRKIMDVCKDFAIKMLRSPRKGKGSATRSKELARKATVTASPASPGSSPESSHSPRTSEAPGPMMMLSLYGTMETGSKAASETGLSTMDTHWTLPEQGGFDMGQEFDFSDWPLWNQALAEGSSYGWSNSGMGSPYKMTFEEVQVHSDNQGYEGVPLMSHDTNTQGSSAVVGVNSH